MDKNKCSSCGAAPHKCSCKNKEFTKAVIEIDNPEQITLMRKVVIPTSMGDDTTVPPVVGKYHNVLLYYEANQKSYLYSSDGIPTQLVNGLTDYEAAVNLPQINGNTLIGDKTGEELGLQDKLTAGDNITIENDVISATDTTYGPATDTEIGLVKPGDGLEVDTNGTISISDIEQYAHFFDTVADMKAATNLKDGDYAKTGGFYNTNDGGGALYCIREVEAGDAVNECTLIAITGTTLVAELIKTSIMDVLQFGCINDGSVDTSTRFNRAMSFCKNLTVSEGTYLLSSKFNPPQGMYMRGIGAVNLNLGGTSAQANLNSNVHLENLILKSVAGNLAWSRTDITDKNNIELINCTFQDFLDPDTKNAWGLEMRRCNNILVRGCHFENNTTSDIAMVAGCTNVTIDNCSGTNFNILVEPSGTPIAQNIKISNCDIKVLQLLENQLTTNLIRNMSVENCTIEKLSYDGADVCFIACKILSIVNAPSNGAIYGGSLKFVNSGNFSENLLKDPYLDTYIQTGAGNTTNEWYQEYTTGSGTPYTSITDDNGVQFVLNPDGVARVTGVGHQNITLTDTKSFILRINGKCVYPSGTTFVSNIASVKWYDNENNQLDRQAISMFRSADDSSSEFAEQSVILTPPENATKMNITLSNGVNATGGSTNSKKTVYIRSVELFKINPDNLNTATEIPVLPIRQHRIFYNDVKPTSQYGYYSVGDRMYYNTPSTHIGAVCTVAGKGGTWKNFGELES